MALTAIAPYEVPAVGSWPVCRASWRLEPRRAALLVHDMQAYFLAPYDAQAEPCATLLRNVRRLVDACRRADVPVLFSAQPGEQDRAERGLLWDLWGPGIVERPELARLCDGLSLGERDVLLHKRRYSAFYETRLFELLAERGRDQLLICGVYAHIGCLATATDGFIRGVQPFLVSDVSADFSLEDHSVALRQVARTCGVVTTTHDALARLSSPQLTASGSP